MKYILYNRRTCVTGKQLFDWLKSNDEGWMRKSSDRYPWRGPVEATIVWGNSLIPPPEGSVVLNANSSNASDKATMASMISSLMPPLIPLSGLDESCYIRDRNDHVRYDNTVMSGDKYATKAIYKDKEWRVHVIGQRVVGVYEKIPNDGDLGLIRKDENCRFVRIDMSDPNKRAEVRGVRPIAKEAVKVLGLDFGGVDVIRDASNGNLYVNEVNSAPALNTPNIERWGRILVDMVGEKLSLSSGREEQFLHN